MQMKHACMYTRAHARMHACRALKNGDACLHGINYIAHTTLSKIVMMHAYIHGACVCVAQACMYMYIYGCSYLICVTATPVR